MLELMPDNWQVAINALIEREPNWQNKLDRLWEFLRNENEEDYHPNGRAIFTAFDKTAFDDVRVVIIGRDPYPREGDATGIAFFSDGNMTDSLTNIYAAMGIDGMRGANLLNACPKRWAEEEDVLLLNPVLTFCGDNNDKNLHKGKGWENFTKATVRALSNREASIHFILWGHEAQKFKPHIKGKCYHIHKSPHPTPRNPDDIQGFLNCRHFSAVNNILREREEEPINWIRDLTPEEAQND